MAAGTRAQRGIVDSPEAKSDGRDGSSAAAELTAIIWDFDGTLVDTRAKNLNVTRALVEEVLGRSPDAFPALRSLEDYETALHRHTDWKKFYRTELEMSDEEVLTAGSRWMKYQIRDRTAAEFYDGIPEVLRSISDVPQGIVSLNSRDNILRFLSELEVDAHFDEVLGYEAVDMHRQKPEPDALVMCIETLTESRAGKVLFIGDHETDVQCAHNTSEHFRQQEVPVEVLSIAAFYGPRRRDPTWSARPHFEARDPRDILEVVGTLSS